MTDLQIFMNAPPCASAEERKSYLDGACKGDLTLRARVEALFQAEAKAGGFMKRPAREVGPAGTVFVDSPLREGPGTQIGRYKLLQEIGAGGFGVVYMAEQKEPVKRRVALKIIKVGMDTQQVVARFEAERQALAIMEHPNIAKVLDGGATDTGRPYFVMELVHGVRITEYCDENQLTTKERLELFILVCQAIQHAHQKGIVHRDIKPSNVMVTLHDGAPVPKVIDFGIAKATQVELTEKTIFTQYGQFIGTPAYMSPEQAEMSGLDIDTRSDIYSLGVLLYELLTGVTPFDAHELMASGIDAMRKTIREKEPPRPSTRLSKTHAAAASSSKSAVRNPRSAIHSDLDWIVLKALEKDRTRRYETVNGLAADITRYLTNEPVVARPPSSLYRLQKLVRRNRLAVSAGAAVAAALVAGLILAAIGWRQTQVERDKAVQARTGEEAQRRTAQANAIAAQEQSRRAEQGEAHALRLVYRSNMILAGQAWEQSNVGLVRELLEETEASPNRGFEWYYWQRQTHLELMTLRGHQGTVTSVAFSPDGQRIVTGSKDRTAKIWEAATGKELLTLSGPRNIVNSVAFSPDGERVVTTSDGNTAKVWETVTGKELLTLRGHGSEVQSVAFSPDGQRIVTGSDDQTAKVWNAASGQELLALKGHLDAIRSSIAFSPDGQRIVTGSEDRTVKVWEAASGKELLTLKGHSYRVRSTAFSPDGQRIITGSDDQTVKVWEAASGKELFMLSGHRSCVTAAAFSQDGQRLVTGSEDRTARVWDTAGGGVLLKLQGHGNIVTSVAFSPDGRRIVTGSADNTAKVWEAASGKELLTLKGHSDFIRSVAYSTDGQRIVTGSEDAIVKVWDAISGTELLRLDGRGSYVWAVAFSPDSRWIVAACEDTTAKVWDTASGTLLLTLQGHSGSVNSVAFAPDGRRIVTGSGDNTTKLWDAASGKELLTLKEHTGPIAAVAFSPDGQRIVTGSWDGTAKVWEAATAKQVAAWQAEEQAAR